MKKILVIILAAVIFISLFSVGAMALGEEKAEDEYWREFLEALPEGIDAPKNEEELLSGVGFDSLLSELMSAAHIGASSAVSLFILQTASDRRFSDTRSRWSLMSTCRRPRRVR